MNRDFLGYQKEGNLPDTPDLNKDSSHLEKSIYCSEKKPTDQSSNYLNLSSKQSPSLIDDLNSVNKTKRMSKNNHHNWRQMLTPHQMNDLTQNDYNTNQNISRPSNCSPENNNILGTDHSTKQDEQMMIMQTHDLSEKINNMKTFHTEEEELKESIISYRNLYSQNRNMMSINSNLQLRSIMMQTLKGDKSTMSNNGLDFFKNLEKQYFMKAIKQNSSKSPSVDELNFPQNNQMTESQMIDQIQDLSQQSSVSQSLIDETQQNHISKGPSIMSGSNGFNLNNNDQSRGSPKPIYFNLQNYFKEFHEQKQKQLMEEDILNVQDNQISEQQRKEAFLQASINQLSLGGSITQHLTNQDSFANAQSQNFSEFNFSPQLFRNRRIDNENQINQSPPLNSKIFQSSQNSREQSESKVSENKSLQEKSKQSQKNELKINIDKVKEINESINNSKHKDKSIKSKRRVEYQEVQVEYPQNEDDILQTYRNNCEVARNLVQSTYNQPSTQRTSINTQGTLKKENQMIILNRTDSSPNCTSDVYQTAKFNNIAQTVESLQNTLSYEQCKTKPFPQLQESQNSYNIQSKRESQGIQSSIQSDNFNNQVLPQNMFLFEENVQLKNYLRKAYQCVVTFLNNNDPRTLNPNLVQDLQIFADLEQNKREWIQEEQQFNSQPQQEIRRESMEFQSPPNSSQQQSRFQQQSFIQSTPNANFQNYEIQENYENSTPTSSIETNLSGIKQNLKETKKSLLQAKKLLFQEKCISVDHEKQIQELNKKIQDIQQQVQHITQSQIQFYQNPVMNQFKSPDEKKFNNFLNGIQSPVSQVQPTSCTKCCSSIQNYTRFRQYPISPINFETLSRTNKGNLQNLSIKFKLERQLQKQNFKVRDELKQQFNLYYFKTKFTLYFRVKQY